MAAKTFRLVATLAVMLIILCAGCKPLQGKKTESREGVYILTENRVLDNSSQPNFRITDKVFYPVPDKEGIVGINDTDKVLTLGDVKNTGRCMACHTCGFPEAWDEENYGTPEWSPAYIGKEWAPSVQRMRMMDNALLNEKIADRIYEFLRLETLGEYDESKDDKGAFVIQR